MPLASMSDYVTPTVLGTALAVVSTMLLVVSVRLSKIGKTLSTTRGDLEMAKARASSMESARNKAIDEATNYKTKVTSLERELTRAGTCAVGIKEAINESFRTTFAGPKARMAARERLKSEVDSLFSVLNLPKTDWSESPKKPAKPTTAGASSV